MEPHGTQCHVSGWRDYILGDKRWRGIIDVYHAIIGKCLYKVSKRDAAYTA